MPDEIGLEKKKKKSGLFTFDFLMDMVNISCFLILFRVITIWLT